jgi:hypothetical protein
MKAIFVSFYQAFYDELLAALEKNNVRIHPSGKK